MFFISLWKGGNAMTTLGIRLPFDEKMKFMRMAEQNDLSAS